MTIKKMEKALGGQYYGLFIDEFNIADMEFVREAFMRADYRLCTMNQMILTKNVLLNM